MEAYFLAGAICTLFVMVATYFLKFWRRTGDSLFIFFSIAFFLLAIERFLIALFVGRTTVSYVYLIRLLAFCLIIAAFVRKNRR